MNSQLQFFCPYWGSEHLSYQVFLKKVKAEGFDGVEMSLPFEDKERDRIVSLIEGLGLKLIAQHWETVDSNFDTHLIKYKKRLNNLAAANPLFINSQTGKDYFTFEENKALIDAAEEIAIASGVQIVHETHRGKFSFAAHITHKYFAAIPNLQLALDISHWCCVAETLLEDQAEAVDAAIAHTSHIHSRVGYSQGPQVMDPRAPEWLPVVKQFIQWWQRVYDKNKKQEVPTTITTEFGPAPYLQLFPYTQMPLYSQWDVNVYMMHLLRSALV